MNKKVLEKSKEKRLKEKSVKKEDERRGGKKLIFFFFFFKKKGEPVRKWNRQCRGFNIIQNS